MISRWSLQRPPVRLASLATRLKQGRPPHIDCPRASTCLNPALHTHVLTSLLTHRLTGKSHSVAASRHRAESGARLPTREQTYARTHFTPTSLRAAASPSQPAHTGQAGERSLALGLTHELGTHQLIGSGLAAAGTSLSQLLVPPSA